MFASVLSAAILGMEVRPILVEADVSDGLPSFTMVGFPSAQVKEAQDRVRTALKNNGIFLRISYISSASSETVFRYITGATGSLSEQTVSFLSSIVYCSIFFTFPLQPADDLQEYFGFPDILPDP